MNYLSDINEHLITLIKLGLTKEIVRCPELFAVPKDSQYLDYKLLRLAVQCNEIDIVQIFITLGFRMNPDTSKHEPADTPLHLAVERNNKKLLQLLLQHYASVEHKNQHGLTPLQAAVKSGNAMAVDTIIRELENRHYMRRLIEMKHLSTMHAACLRDDWDEFQRILKCGISVKDPVPLSSPIWPGCTNLHLAVIGKSVKIMEFLISRGIDTASRDVMNFTALQLAVRISDQKLIASLLRLYIDHNVGLTETDSDGITLLHLACSLDNSELGLSYELIKKGANIHATTSLKFTEAPGYTPLHFACKSGSYSDVRVLMSYGADPTVKNGNGETPIHLVKEMPKIVMECFKKYKKFINDTTDQFGTSHFHLACLYGHVKLVNEFLDHRPWTDCSKRVTTSPSIIAYHGSTPLHLAVRLTTNLVSDQCQSQVLKSLLKCTLVDVNERDFHGQTALHIIMESGNKRFATEVLTSHKKIDVNARNSKGQTALHLAVQRCDLASQVNMLIDAKANLLAMDSNDQTPIHLARENIVPYLLRAFIEEYNFNPLPNPRNQYGISIFDIACDNYMRNREARIVVNMFLKSGVDDKTALISLKRIEASSTLTALHIATEELHETTVKTLLRLGLQNVNDVIDTGATALHFVAIRHHYTEPENCTSKRMRIARMLIDNGSDIEAAMYDCKSTGLHWAVRSNIIEMVELLLTHKASVSPKDKWQHTPLHLAAQNCSLEIMQMLIRAGADVTECDVMGSTALHKITGKHTGNTFSKATQNCVRSENKLTVERYTKLIDTLLYAPNSDSNIDVMNDKDETPLSIAYEMNNFTCVKALLNHGAEPQHIWYWIIDAFVDNAVQSPSMFLVAQQMIRLQEAKLIVDRELGNMLRDVEIIIGPQTNLREACREELMRLAEVNIDPYTTLKDFLYKNVYECKPYVSNLELQKIIAVNVGDEERKELLSLLMEKYPNYAPLLRKSYMYALQHENIMQEAEKALQTIAHHVIPEEATMRIMPRPCIETVLKMVDCEDFHNLVEAVFHK